MFLTFVSNRKYVSVKGNSEEENEIVIIKGIRVCVVLRNVGLRSAFYVARFKYRQKCKNLILLKSKISESAKL